MGAIQAAMTHWEYIAPVLTSPQTEAEYQQLVDDLDIVLDEGGADENHPLAGLAERMADLIADYENQHHQIRGSGIDALKFLMAEHKIGQTDLPEVVSQGVVSEVLNGKRELNIRQIRELAKRFGVAEQVFI